MRLPFLFSLTSLALLVMSFDASHAGASEYEDAREMVVKQRWSEALPLLKKLNEEEPDSITIAKDLAQVLLRLNRREEALDVLRQHKLSKHAQIAGKSFLSKESFRFYQQGLDWMAKKSYPQACERFEKALEKDQAHADVLLRLAQCEIFEGNGDLSLRLFEQLERIHGKTPESTAWRAKSALLRGKPDEALLLLNSISNDPKLGDALSEWVTLWTGEALTASGQKSQAATIYEADLKRFPGHLQVGLALLRSRLANAESPNQFLQLAQDLDAFEKKIVQTKNAEKNEAKKTRDFILTAFDADALQRGVAELRELIRPQLPSPVPSKS
jgi:tetratricopeptide (TPR) repeat protein